MKRLSIVFAVLLFLPHISLAGPIPDTAQTEGADIYEVDDMRSQANVIVPDHPTPQPHNFHYAADEDWIKFYGLSDQYYTIEAGNLGADCEPIIELYYEDGTVPIEVVGLIVNNKVSIDFKCLEDGIYYLLLNNGTDGEETGYEIQVDNQDAGGLLVLVTGRVQDQVSLGGLDGVFITTNGGGAAISSQGEYDLYQKPGPWFMQAQAEGYRLYTDTLQIRAGDQIIIKDTYLNRLNYKDFMRECRSGQTD